jgi:hypothetical protein
VRFSVDDFDRPRTYFTVTDEFGATYPAMEYIAGTLDEHPVFHVVPLKKFVKLIGSGEHLEGLGDGDFVGLTSRRRYSAAAPPKPEARNS